MTKSSPEEGGGAEVRRRNSERLRVISRVEEPDWVFRGVKAEFVRGSRCRVDLTSFMNEERVGMALGWDWLVESVGGSELESGGSSEEEEKR